MILFKYIIYIYINKMNNKESNYLKNYKIKLNIREDRQLKVDYKEMKEKRNKQIYNYIKE